VDASDRTIDRLQRAQALAKLVGDAPAFRAVISRLPAVARADATVLLHGETGTGKELVARAIHYLSGRSTGPFTAVNCGSLPDTLLEAELFGHERGAFTDAKSSRPGLLRDADGGTLFLDEVDSLTPRAQVALLRVLQDRSYRALGSRQEQHVDVRVIAASNADLAALVARSEFRADLYYRLGVLSVELPPLRERVEDLLPLAHHFLTRFTPADRPALRLAADAKEALRAHRWPGNVRELENAVLRAVSLSEGTIVTAADLGLPPVAPRPAAPAEAAPVPAPPLSTRILPQPDQIDLARPFGELKREVLGAFERAYLTKLMAACRGNVSRAARRAQKERRDLGRLLKKYQLDPRAFGLPV
jgi:DNA-binding NtrC family response regulator